MKYKINKKGRSAGGFINLVIGIFIAIVLLIFLTGGGVGKIFEITRFLKSIPTFVWVVLGVIILFKLLNKKK